MFSFLLLLVFILNSFLQFEFITSNCSSIGCGNDGDGKGEINIFSSSSSSSVNKQNFSR